MRQILIFFILLSHGFAIAQTVAPTTEQRCKCRARRDFLLAKSDSCFSITRAEADRFFACRCWDDAMSLYRAAKSCTDANQNARSQMNQRIQACRDSAEQELRDSEQAARRQFLHATAANLADDAQELLKNHNRTTAYRLADFAGQYVAPGPNADCQQALLDAWYYVPPKMAGYPDFRTPFCYQLDYDMGNGVQVRFGKKGKSLIVYAFAPSSHTLFSWEADSMKARRPVLLEEGLHNFDISPDGRTLLFYSNRTLLFWRSASETFRVNVQGISRYCFSPNGDEFLFFDKNEGKIYALDMRNAYVQRKGEQRLEPRLLLSNVNGELLGIAYRDERIWLGGKDSLLVLERAGKETQWVQKQAVRWGKESLSGVNDLVIFPDRDAVFAIGDDSIKHFRLPGPTEDQLVAIKIASMAGTAIAVKPDASQVAHSLVLDDIVLISTDSGVLQYGTYSQSGDVFQPMAGAFSPDGKWLAAATDTGALKIWALADGQSEAGASLADRLHITFSQNGEYLACSQAGNLQVCNADQVGKPLFNISDFSEETSISAVSKDWVAWRSGEQLLSLKNGLTGKQWQFEITLRDDSAVPVALDDDGNFVAYSAKPDSLVVRSLLSGETTASVTFNGEIVRLHFVPNSSKLMAILSVSSNYYADNQLIAKIWDTAELGDKKSNTIRLHEYQIRYTAVAPDGSQVAFSNGDDIRVFGLGNLLDEAARIRPNGKHSVVAMAFHPDGTALAAGYEDGEVVVWDLAKGEQRYRLNATDQWVEELSFCADGSRLRLKTLDGMLFSRIIDPDRFRAAAQDAYRRLVAFTPDQIREYELESALAYSGNFQRLAESGDLPLIRSFFEYYHLQALSSSNIDRVKSYFESASSLFSKLDDPATQRALRPMMHEIYEDYNWKLLLREKNQEAAKVLNDFNRIFNRPLTAVKMGAHTSLLNNDLSAAGRQYTDWATRIFENPVAAPSLPMALDSMQTKFRQLADYDLLNQTQTDCICGLYANILEINFLCPEGGILDALPFDTETRLRWKIFQNLYGSARVSNLSEKTALLQATLADAKTLYRKNPAARRSQLERTVLALADAYTDQGVFEQENARSSQYYQDALRLLDTFGVFKTDEAHRLKSLAINRLKLGTYLLSKDKTMEAATQFEAGLKTVDQLLNAAPPDSVIAYRNDRQAPLLSQLGIARLLEGNTAATKTAFDRANEAFVYGIYPMYFGHVALLENKEKEALEQYRGIYNEVLLGQALFEISRMAGRLPQYRARLEAFMPVLRDTILRQHPELSPDAVDHWYAFGQTAYAYANEQWEATLQWNTQKLAVAEKLSNQPDASTDWKSRRLDAMLSQSFYFLHLAKRDPEAFTKAIQLAEQAESYAEKEHPYYAYRDWVKTNLAHAYLLRNRRGDREAAIAIYIAFLKTPNFTGDNWELLQKDFRDLHRVGLQWPDLKGVIELIKPKNIKISVREWQEMGVVSPGN